MPDINFTFGLDFGTSKTAITLAKTGVNNPNVEDLLVEGQADRIPTCVLRDKTTGAIYIGAEAEQEYQLQRDPVARANFEFFSNFKPQIHQGDAYRQMAQHFLNEFCRKERIAGEFARYKGDAMIAVGCPVSWDAGAADLLRSLLRDAGFPPAFAIPEPVGAAFYFLSTKLKADAFHRDIVVFDWGAGTFDMTVLPSDQRMLDRPRTWGSSVYGGRLFDDLFYQWLCDAARNQGLVDEVRKLEQHSIERDVLQGVKCRKIKELFSQYYATHKPDESWACLESTRVGIRERKVDLGEFEVARISELDERMRDYRASEFVLEWLKLDRQIRPEEEHFVNALMAGRSVDLRGWANVLIEAGLMNLRVAEGANALLTGGSCSWKWFQDLIKEHALFKGRQTAVHNDTRPELTIARGLARVYAVGSYSKQLVQEVQASRDNLVLDLKAIHSGLLDTLSLELTALMKADDRLIGDLRLIFRDSIREVRASARQNMSQPSIGKVLDGIMRDHFAELVRPRLEARTSKWLNDNQLKLRRWSERFAIAAHQHIRDVLKKNIRSEIGGLVEVAIEACDATGGTPFDEALAELGGKVRFGPSIVDRLLKQGIDIWNRLFPGLATEASASDSDQQIENEASQAIERLVTALPGAIRTSIVGVQPAQRWADQVINHLLKTLRMLVMVARVEEANDARDRAY